MKKFDPTDSTMIADEVRQAITFRQKHHADMHSRIRRLTGNGYKNATDDGEPEDHDSSLINHQAAWLSVMLPAIVHHNPKAAVSGGRAMSAEASVTKNFLDALSKHHQIKEELKLAARDYGMWWGFFHTTVDEHTKLSMLKKGKDHVFLPYTERFSFTRLVIDPHCEDARKARFVGHIWVADHDELIDIAKDEGEDRGWDLEAVKGLSADANLKMLEDRDTKDLKVSRNEVVCVELWIPGYQDEDDPGPDEGFHGSTMTIVLNESAKQTIIRKPKAYFGPEYGPYDIPGYMQVPGSPIPCSPLTLTTGQEQLLAEMSMNANDGARSYRKVVLVPAGTGIEESMELAALGKNLVIEVPGLDPTMKPIEIEMGGVTPQQITNMQYAERSLHMISGMDAAQQGNVDGDGTATEHAIAQQGMATRKTGIVDGFHDAVDQIFQRWAWYLWHDDRIQIPVQPDIEDTDETGIPWIKGSGSREDTLRYMLLQINVEAMSMERTTDAMHQQRAKQAYEIVVALVPVIRQYPELDGRRLLGMVGDAMNLPDLGSLVDMDMVEQLIGVEPNTTPSIKERGGSQQPQQTASQGSLMGQAVGQEAARQTAGVLA